MNRQQVAAIAQAVQYRLDTLWLPEEEGMTPAQQIACWQGIMGAKLAALERIYLFNDPAPCPDDWEGYG